MKVMVIVKATKDTEAGVMPSTELLSAMGNFNEELVKAGIMLAGEGLHPSSKGKRVEFTGKAPRVTDGPFAETKEQLLGLYLVDFPTIDAAVEAARDLRRVNPTAVYEIRPIALYRPGGPLEAGTES